MSRNKPLDKFEKSRFIQLYMQGWSIERIAGHYGRHQSVVSSVLKMAGARVTREVNKR